MRASVLAGVVVLVLAAVVPGRPASAAPATTTVILATTTSTQDSGLLDVLVPLFERRTGYTVKTIAVGTGQALALAARGEADVTLAHAPELERRHVAAGKLLNRRLVMYNDFVIVGPPEDPAKIAGARRAVAAMRAIADRGARFVSRGDHSGTHALETSLWRLAGVEPRGAWYVEAGQGMGATLVIAHDRQAYTLSDRATYLAFARRVRLAVHVQGDRALVNLYAVLEVNPSNGPRVNAAGGKALADFLVSADAQSAIRVFGVERFGQPLFVPVAGSKEEDVR